MHSGSGRRSPSLGSDLTFATRTGSRQGIEMHVFRVETHRDLSCWTRVLVQGCHAAAELIKEVSVGECALAARGCARRERDGAGKQQPPSPQSTAGSTGGTQCACLPASSTAPGQCWGG